jgi:hypothetical protein
VPSKTASLPTPDGVGSHEYEGLPPPGPDPGQPNPKQAIHRAQPGAAYRSLVHGDLVTQSEVLEGELAVTAEKGKSRSRWSRRVIIELRLWPDHDQHINHSRVG